MAGTKTAGTTRRSSRSRTAARATARKWSAAVTRESNALDLEPKVFTSASPRAIAHSLKRSAETSKRRKAQPFQSAMSMLNLYINRAGKTLPASRKDVLEKSKEELRKAFGRTSRQH